MADLVSIISILTISVFAQSNSTSVNLNETLNITAPFGDAGPSPQVSDLSINYVIAAAGMIFLLVLRLSKRARQAIVHPHTFKLTSGWKTPYHSLKMEVLEKMGNGTSANLRALMAIYGILLSFIVSIDIGIALRNWTFTVWAGWLLALIVRMAFYTSKLSDTLYVNNAADAAETIFLANKFYRHAAYLLVLAVGMTPAFFFAPAMQTVDYPWTNAASVISVGIAVGVVTVMFYVWIQIVENFYRYSTIGIFLLYMTVATGLGVSSLGVTTMSPLEQTNVSFFGSQAVPIPAIIEIIARVVPSAVIGYVISYVGLVDRVLENSRRRRRRSDAPLT